LFETEDGWRFSLGDERPAGTKGLLGRTPSSTPSTGFMPESKTAVIERPFGRVFDSEPGNRD
jgi:hypothetical protein